jgi:hypothetical protein
MQVGLAFLVGAFMSRSTQAVSIGFGASLFFPSNIIPASLPFILVLALLLPLVAMTP